MGNTGERRTNALAFNTAGNVDGECHSSLLEFIVRAVALVGR